MDFCEYNYHNYLIISDNYSRFLEILQLPSTTSAQVILRLKGVFARFKECARQLDFKYCTSSPHHLQGNGHAERKKILKQADPACPSRTASG